LLLVALLVLLLLIVDLEIMLTLLPISVRLALLPWTNVLPVLLIMSVLHVLLRNNILMEPNAMTAKTLTNCVLNVVTNLHAQHVLVLITQKTVNVLPVLKDVPLVLPP